MAMTESAYQTGVKKSGMSQADLVALLRDLVTSYNDLLTKLDADGGVTDTNYASLHSLTATRISVSE